MQHHQDGRFKEQLYAPHAPQAGGPEAAAALWNAEGPGLPPPPPPLAKAEGIAQVRQPMPSRSCIHVRATVGMQAQCHPGR